MSDCKQVTEISQGERKELTVSIVNELTGEGIDLTNVTEIQGVFRRAKEFGGYLVKLLEKTGVAEQATIQVVGDTSGSLNSKSFKYETPSNKYRFYFSVDGNGVDPTGSEEIGVPVPIAENDSANDNAVALQGVMNGLTDITATVLGDTVTATNNDQGEAGDAVDVDSGSTITVTQQGVTEVVDSIEKVGSSQVKIKLSDTDTQTLLVDSRQTFHLVVDFPIGEGGRQIYKVADAYSVCESEFASFLK